MRIGLISQSCDKRTGIGRIVNSLATEYIGLGHEVLCAAQNYEGTDGRIAKRRVPRITSSKGINKVLFRFAGPRFSAPEVDVTHTFGVGRGAHVVSAQSCHRAGLALLETMDDQMLERHRFGLFDRVSLADERALFTSQSTRKIIAVSRLVKSQITNSYGVTAEKISIIPNGVNIGTFERLKNQVDRFNLRSRLGYSGDDFVLLFVGNEFGRKGLQTVLRAMSALGDKKVRLLVVGGGERETYGKLAHDLGLAQSVKFLGNVSEPESLYFAADSFVLPSLYEPFGIVIIEAMAAGVPVITSRQSGATEEMQDRKHVVHLDNPTSTEELSEAIRVVMCDESLRRALVDAGMEKAKEYSWDRIAQRMLATYEEVGNSL